jgi:uncharacterized membrane protein YedE/YeeE
MTEVEQGESRDVMQEDESAINIQPVDIHAAHSETVGEVIHKTVESVGTPARDSIFLENVGRPESQVPSLLLRPRSSILYDGRQSIEKPTDPKQDNLQTKAFKSILLFVTSFIFGLVLEKSRVFAPEVIQGQMFLHNWRLVKFFLMAIGLNQVVLGLLMMYPTDVKSFIGRFAARVQHLRTFRGTKSMRYDDTMVYKSHQGPIPIIIGGLLVGAGMAIGGLCPGTIYVQAGAGLKSGGIALAGGLLGALVFVLCQRLFINMRFWTMGQTWFVNNYAFKSFGVISVPSGITCICLAVTIHFLTTQHSEFDYFYDMGDKLTKGKSLLRQVAWDPILAGVFASVMVLLPNIIFMSRPYGMSTTYPAILTPFFAFKPILSNLFPERPSDIADFHFPSFEWGNQMLNVLGMFLGGLLSSVAAGNHGEMMDYLNYMNNPKRDPTPLLLFHTSMAVRVIQPLLAGFLVVFGSRMAGGCPTGHGLTGITLLKSTSILLGVPSMFIGGVITGIVMKAALTQSVF